MTLVGTANNQREFSQSRFARRQQCTSLLHSQPTNVFTNGTSMHPPKLAAQVNYMYANDSGDLFKSDLLRKSVAQDFLNALHP